MSFEPGFMRARFRSQLLIAILIVQECDATDDATYNAAGFKKILKEYEVLTPLLTFDSFTGVFPNFTPSV